MSKLIKMKNLKVSALQLKYSISNAPELYVALGHQVTQRWYKAFLLATSCVGQRSYVTSLPVRPLW